MTDVPIPDVCFIQDLARILRMSRRQIDVLRKRGVFPIPELERIDNRRRWSGADVNAYLRRERVSARPRRIA